MIEAFINDSGGVIFRWVGKIYLICNVIPDKSTILV